MTTVTCWMKRVHSSGKTWSGKIQNYWNEITQTAAITHNLSIEQTARLFALVNFGMADATISLFEAKYVYHLWRPVTPAELTDFDWLPLSTCRESPATLLAFLPRSGKQL